MFMNFSENLKNCKCGKTHSFDSEIVVGSGVIGVLPEKLKKLNADKVFLIADKNTKKAAGDAVCEILRQNDICVCEYVFANDNLEPDESAVGLAVMNFNPQCDAVVSVGSGVINDIGKIVASVSQKPYIIVATAPSMDGYASATSSMTMQGLKISLNSKCADIIIGDTDILRKAPMKMLVSGLGDMVAKYVSICEWRISNLINGEYYCEEIAQFVRSALEKCVDNADGLLKREKEAVEAVFEGLIIGGVAMKFAGLSRPASGVEHYLSHIWDMRGAEFETPTETHGIQCAVGTLISARLYEKIKNITPDKQKAVEYVESFDFAKWSETLREFLGKGAESMIALEEKEQKYNLESHKKRIDLIIEKWEDIRNIISEELPSSLSIEELFDKIGMPKTMNEIGLCEEILPLTFKAAKDIRDKYVLPRLCWDLGILDEILN